MKQEIIKFATKTGNFLVKNSPHIFTGLAVAGVVGTIALVIKAQHEADDIVTEEESVRIVDCENDHNNEYQPVTFKDRIKMTWKCYIPATISGVSTIGFIIASDTINTKRMTALSALYAASQKALEEYKENVKEVVDNKTLKEINKRDIEKTIESNPWPIDDSFIPRVGRGTLRCIESITGKQFYGDPAWIEDAKNRFNSRLNIEYQLTVNDWIDDYLGIGTGGEILNCVGFNSHELLDLSIDYITASDGYPIAKIRYNTEPRYSYKEW